MQEFSQKYVLVHAIQDWPDVYEYSMEDWPLHVTLAGTFSIEGEPADLIKDLGHVLASLPIARAKVVDEAWFGKDENIHVMLLDRTKDLQDLHEKILEVLENHHVQFNSPEYAGKNFRPHATVQKSAQLKVGDVVTFDSVTLIDMFPDKNPYQRRVLGTIQL